MYDRIFLPVMGLILQREPFEKMFFILENRFQCGQGQRFSETAGAGKEINTLGFSYQIPDIFRFIDIEPVAFDKVFKSIYLVVRFFISCIQIYS